ncbi:MAG: hypothetical protein IKM02_03115 [Clostridia bacterium]|nr:hypothetical protein [Clostridia bacterium]
MKIRRFLSVLLVLTLSALLLTACEGKKDTWTLDEALKMVGTDQAAALNGRIPLSDDFSGYDPVGGWDYTPSDGKIIILWRECAEPEYSRSSFPFPDMYRGDKSGADKVYLCADLMELIPEQYRAASTAEAGNILMADSNYFFDGMIESSGDNRRPSEPGIEAEESIWNTHGMNTDEYRPLFISGIGIYLYNMETRERLVGESIFSDYAELRDNPEADDLWEEMLTLRDLSDAMTLEKADDRREYGQIHLNLLMYASALPQRELDALSGMIMRDEAQAVIDACAEFFWSKAQELIELDPEFEEEYAAAISARSFDALSELISARAFAYVPLTHEEIRIRKAYIGTPDLNALHDLLIQAVDTLDQAGWDLKKNCSELQPDYCLGG